MEDDLFGWYWKVRETLDIIFWFEENEEGFGYRRTRDPEIFTRWNKAVALDLLHTFVKHAPREVLGPTIPPVIYKIRTMEQRHKKYLNRKCHAI